ncbi:MAG: DUF5655 domain-containing protein [Candidatus Saccharimonas sp.]
MALFKNTSDILTEIAEKPIQLEKHIQKLTEDNLETVLGLEFVATEFEHDGLRLDTVAYDKETGAFVIIEYKRDRSFSVVDQGYAYLSLLLNNKAEFVLLYNEHTGKTLTKTDIDWTQSRVIFIAQAFTIHQQQAINFRDMPIELWRVKMYDNDTVLYDQLKPKATVASINTVTKDPVVRKVTNEVKVYDVTSHFAGTKAASTDIYELLRDRLVQWQPKIQENPRKSYIGFSLKDNGTDTIVYVHVHSNGLRAEIPRIEPQDVNDPLRRLLYKENSRERFNTPVSYINVKTEDDVEYLLSILRQVYAKFFDK